MIERIQAAGLAFGAVIIAAGWLAGSGWLVLALVVPALAIGLGQLLHHLGTRTFLPAQPARSVEAIDMRWIGYVGVGALIGAVPMAVAAKLPEAFEDDQSAGQLLGVVLAVSLVEIAKSVAIDSKWMENRLSAITQESFKTAYDPQLETNGGPLHKMADTDHFTEEWTAVYLQERWNGWERKGGRDVRADVLREWIQNEKPRFK